MAIRNPENGKMFRPYKSRWDQSRSSKKKKSFAIYLFWALALLILIVIILFRLAMFEQTQ